MADSSAVVRGSCACRAITYQATSFAPGSLKLTRCHCVECRKTSGSAFLPFVALGNLTFSKPATDYYHSEQAKRGFCSACGSCMYMTYEKDLDNASVCAGTIDWWKGKDEGVPFGNGRLLEEDIYLNEKASWVQIGEPDGVSRFSKNDEESQKQLREWESKIEKMKGVGV